MKKKKYRIIIALLLMTAAACASYYIYEYCTAQNEIAEYAEIEQEHTATSITYLYESDDETGDFTPLPYKTIDFAALLAVNPDTVGWIQIPYSLIDYPVVQAPDNQTYLGRSFTGEKSRTGAIFMDKDNDAENLSQNTILYGHNMGNGRTDMFGTLLFYNDREHFENHRFIQFDTIYEQHGWWEIFAVIHYDTRNDSFDYLQLTFENQGDFMEWAAAAKSLSIYDTGVEVKPDDRVLTLSTCDGEIAGKYGRQLILARKIG